MQSEGKPITEIAQALGLSRARVVQLIWQSRAEERAMTQPPVQAP